MRACSTKWKKFGRKTLFCDELKDEWDMHSEDDTVMCLGDINGHIGSHIDGFDEVHGVWCRSEKFTRKEKRKVTLMDTLVVILMDLMRFMGYGVGQRNLRERKRGR